MRNQLTKKQNEIEKGRQEKLKLLEQQKQELKKAEKDKDLALQKVQTEKEFMQRELDQVTDSFQMLQKQAKLGRPPLELANGDQGEHSHSKLSKRRKSGDAKPSPPAKRSRMQPANLDEYDLMQSLFPLFVLNPHFCTVFIALPLIAYSLLTCFLSKES